MTTHGRNGGGTAGDAERDPRLDRLYRVGAREEPPARLDAAILAAARREVGARPRAVSARLRAWRVPLSVAAVVVLSVSLVTLVREEGGGQLEQPPAMDLYSKPAETAPAPPAVAPEAAKAPARAKLPAAPPAKRDDAALGATASAKIAEEDSSRAAETSAARSAAPQPQASPRAAAPPPQPFQGAPAAREQRPTLSADQAPAAGTTTQSSGIRGSEAESSAAPAEPAAAVPRPAARMMQRDRAAADDAAGSTSTVRPPVAVVAPAAKPRPRAEARAPSGERSQADAARMAALLKEFELQPPEKWLDKIEALLREGRKGEADEMLAEFKRRFPSHPLPPGLL